MNLHQDFRTVVPSVDGTTIDVLWNTKKQRRRVYIKKNYITVQSFNQHSFLKNYHVIVLGNDVKQMEPLRDKTE